MSLSNATAVKFCGITRAEDARVAAELGAAYIGSIFAESPRRVTPRDAARIWGEAGAARRVGVFGPASVAEILEAADACALDVIQLHAPVANGTVEKVRASFRGEIWSVVRVGGGSGTELSAPSAAADAVLVDTFSETELGGTGRAIGWRQEGDMIRRLVGERPLILAGGLNPDNVADAIRALHPDVVDVSSGVESSPGVKDHARMRAFADAVRQANAE